MCYSTVVILIGFLQAPVILAQADFLQSCANILIDDGHYLKAVCLAGSSAAPITSRQDFNLVLVMKIISLSGRTSETAFSFFEAFLTFLNMHG